MKKEKNNFTKGYIREKNNHPVSFDTEGNLVDQVTGEKGTMVLPEFTVTKINTKNPLYNRSKYIALYTYYPIVSMYPYTGHSRLKMTDIDKDGYHIYDINKTQKHKDYNLITNNCSDATRDALEKTFNKKSNPLLFTTPGDVQDFALKQLNGIPKIKGDSIYDLTRHKYILNKQKKQRKQYRGREVVYIPINDNQKNFLKQYIEQGHKNHLFKKGGNIILKGQQGLITQQDNTKVQKPQVVLPFKLSREQLAKQLAEKNQARIYDKDKADYYRNLQRAYNSNFFGFGVFGNQTNYDSTTTQGQKAIEASANYTKDNISNFGSALITTGVGTVQRGILPLVSRRRTIGQLRDLTKYKIGQGAEAIVINNSPTTVGKITTIPKGEMKLRNSIPNTIKSKFVGYVKDKGSRFPTYVQRKAKAITEEDFPKYIKKLDKAMKKKGYEVVESPDIQYRAYTNGNLVVDDVSPDNIALNWLRKPKMIDFTVSPADSWIY